MPTNSAIIIGGGVAGPATAIALQKIGIQCTIYELRPSPATIGGAIGLSPNAVRVLDNWGLYDEIAKIGFSYEKIEMFSLSSGKLLGQLPFGGKERFGYDSLRVGRSELQILMLRAAVDAGAEVKYGKRLVSVEEREESVIAHFEDGDKAEGDLLLGCDGIHSALRVKYVEPSRVPTYTGISSAYGFVPVGKITAPIHFQEPALNMSHQGSLLTTYCDSEKKKIFLAAVMEVKDQSGHDGWRARGRVAEDARSDLLKRFETSNIPSIAQMTQGIDELFFYPVFTLSNGGQWFKGRAILIGDAAHAVSTIQPRILPLLTEHTRCHQEDRA
jgi:2-polyprenyl-6-methoxyphenol hydroxylase-like FAD-dependent oxidoreductase